MDRPLVTIAVLTYNQKNYIKECLEGVFAQTYEPLEILVSDDASTDGTWEMIESAVAVYRRENGGHRRVVLNRNAENSGIGPHAQKILELANGELLVLTGGDDIPFPSRVERIVDAWMRNGRRASVIVHDVEKIDENGHPLGEIPGTLAGGGILGAAACYVLSAIKPFPRIVERWATEDVVFYQRALLSGPLQTINETLVKYRVGSGVSNFAHNFRKNMLRMYEGGMANVRQIKRDLESLGVDCERPTYFARQQFIARRSAYLSKCIKLYSATTCREKFRAFFSRPWKAETIKTFVVFMVLLLPNQLADRILDSIKRRNT